MKNNKINLNCSTKPKSTDMILDTCGSIESEISVGLQNIECKDTGMQFESPFENDLIEIKVNSEIIEYLKTLDHFIELYNTRSLFLSTSLYKHPLILEPKEIVAKVNYISDDSLSIKLYKQYSKIYRDNIDALFIELHNMNYNNKKLGTKLVLRVK